MGKKGKTEEKEMLILRRGRRITMRRKEKGRGGKVEKDVEKEY